MLNQKGFDLWADDYDRSVGISDGENSYPFAGYRKVLGYIYQTIMEKPGAAVLDIGFGTGILTAKLYENGCVIYGQDFSAEMIRKAAEKMPGAHLYQGDFSRGLAEPLLHRTYDYIVSTYALHHLNDELKISLLSVLLEHLNENGKILIGDVAFETRGALDQCRLDAGEEWDDEEIYFAADELKSVFPNLSFTKISHCSGIITLSR